jgi:hypothetical protein
MKEKKIKMQCGYCFEIKEEFLPLCCLKTNISSTNYQEPIRLCRDCRFYLRGFWKYHKEENHV